MSEQPTQNDKLSLSFEEFWSWLIAHKNCILRAGTPYCALMDHDDFHWDVVNDDDMRVVQLVRAKEPVGEIIILSNEISCVVCPTEETEETLFECVIETPNANEVLYYFLMSHSFEEDLSPIRTWAH